MRDKRKKKTDTTKRNELMAFLAEDEKRCPKFPEEYVNQLINFVKTNDTLYNVKAKQNKIEKARLWEKFGQTIGIDGNFFLL